MDTQILFNIAIALAGFFGGWVLNNISKSIEKLDTDVRALPHVYVTREDYRNDIKEIKEMLNKLFDRLDLKVNK